MQELVQILGGREHAVTLDVAALQLTAVECPTLEIEPFLYLLDSHANELGKRAENCGGEDFVATLSSYFFEELQFEGNRRQYYDPANSCLNEVLLRRQGIPITLSVVCMEVARRLERPLNGIALPGHFILQYDDGEFSAFIDAFNGGQLLDEADCFELASQASGHAIPYDEHLLRPASGRQIVIRMLNNLRSAYIVTEQPRKLLQILDLLIQADPRSAEDYRQRGLVRARLQMRDPARQDFQRFLELAPDSSDRVEVARWISGL
jgi:regulator of sirC expression with transglutaminase-like and TPR domain